LTKCAPLPFGSAEPDYYEVLQLSPNADPDTVHRLFRVLAQRFHPDNRETGDAGTFKSLVRAYEVLVDPARRAAYDAQRPAQQAKRWRIFDNAHSAEGAEAEKRKRHGILSLLYLRRATEPHVPQMALIEFEQLLGCPREHLEFALCVLREDAWIDRTDNGRFSITAKGVHEAESLGEFTGPGPRLIPAGTNA
jgi:curved DNA-binding protein